MKLKEIGGIFLSNGPGDPLTLIAEKEQVQNYKKYSNVCYLFRSPNVSIAHGYDTYKLKFGQHGGKSIQLFIMV